MIAARHLAVVILEILERRDALAALDARWRSASAADQHGIGDDMAAIDTQIGDLVSEARAMIETATGTPWDFIERAGL